MMARLANAAQMRTTTIQDTTMLFCSHLARVAKPRAKHGQVGLPLPKASQMGSWLYVVLGVALWRARRPCTASALRPLLFPESIAKTAHGFNRIAGFPEFFAQAPYMRVHGTGVDYTLVTPDVVEQFIAVLHAPAALH